MGAACLAGLALSAPWTVLSSAADRIRSRDDLGNSNPAVRLDFSEAAPEVDGIQNPTAPTVPPAKMIDPAQVPAEIPGADAAPFPKLDPHNAKANEQLLSKMYPPLPPVGTFLSVELGREGRPIALDDLQRFAEASSPAIRQAAAETGVPTANGAGHFESVFPSQRNAKAITAVDGNRIEANLTRVRADVFASVRRSYFAVLGAQERMRVVEAFVRFTDESYRIQVERAKAGQVLPTEPLQFRAIAYQARAELVQSRNLYLSSWKQLAAAVGRLDLRPTLLEDRIDRPLPVLDFEALHANVLSRNSEVAAAQLLVDKAQITLGSYTSSPFSHFHRADAARARAELARVVDEPDRVRARLTADLVQAYERYDNKRRILAYYRDNIIPDLVSAHRALASRPSPGPNIPSNSDLVLTQQSLAASLATYLQTLEEAWFAVVDIGKLLQARDFFKLGNEVIVTQLACWNTLPSCQIGATMMNWPEATLTNQSATANGTQLFSGPRTAQTPIRLPNENLLEPPITTTPGLARPVSGSALLAPLASIERSTKRRKIFSWPTWRGDSSAPLMLPQTDDATSCCPTNLSAPTTMPKALPQSNSETAPAIKLPDPFFRPTVPTAPRLQPAAQPPLPKIIEAPIDSKSRDSRAAMKSPSPAIVNKTVADGEATAGQLSSGSRGPLLINPYFPDDQLTFPDVVPALRLTSYK